MMGETRAVLQVESGVSAPQLSCWTDEKCSEMKGEGWLLPPHPFPVGRADSSSGQRSAGGEETVHVDRCHGSPIYQCGLVGQVDAVSDMRVLAAAGVAPLSLLTSTL